jgi:hypothetical protein
MNFFRPGSLTTWLLSAVLALTASLALSCGNGEDAPPEQEPLSSASLDRYRYTLESTATGVLGTAAEGGGPTIKATIEGEVAGPARERTVTKMSVGSSTIELQRIRVDDRAWTRSAQDAWNADRADSTAGTAGIQLDNAALIGPEANQRLRSTLSGLTGTDEDVGGMRARRYTVTAPQLRAIMGLPADAIATSIGRIEGDSTLWVMADRMFPLKLVTEAKPTSGGSVQLVLEIRDHNASDIKVEPPGTG